MIQKGMVEDSLKTAFALSKQQGNTQILPLTTHFKSLQKKVFGMSLLFPPIYKMLCSFHLHSLFLYSDANLNNLCHQVYRQSRVRQAVSARLNQRADCTVKLDLWVDLIEGQCAFFLQPPPTLMHDAITSQDFEQKQASPDTLEPYELTEGKSILNYIIYRKDTSIILSFLLNFAAFLYHGLRTW